MPLAHYKIDSSLPELRTCSIVTCQWDLWRSEMRLKLLLIDVVDSLALFTLLCLQQVSEHFCRGLQCTHFCSPVISHALFPAQRKFTSSGAELCPQSHCSGSRCTKGCLCPSPKCRDYLPLVGQDLQVTVQKIPEIFVSGPQQNHSAEETCMKNRGRAQLVRSL